MTVAKASIGVAVVGTGFGRKVHIPGLQGHHRTDLVAVVHRERAKAEEIAAEHGIAHPCDRLEEVLALPDVDAVSVATPPFLHYDMAAAVLRAGKHLLLEKPTALSVVEAEAIAQLTQQQQRIAVMDFEFRYVPAWMRLAELLQEGYVGRPRLVKIDWLVPSRASTERAWNWYSRQDQGGGVLGAFASHTFDYINWLFGPIHRLCARLSTAIPQRPDPVSGTFQPVDADDTCSLMLELTDQLPCQAIISSVTYGGRGHWIEVYGDTGTLVLGSENLKDYVHGFHLWGAAAGDPLQELAVPERLQFPKTYPDGRIAPFIRVVDHWVNCIDSGCSQAPDIQNGVYSQRLMALSRQSHAENRWIEVTP